MKILLFLCIGASLVHLGVQQQSYLTVKIPRLIPSKHLSEYVIVAVEFNYKAMKDAYEDLLKPGSTIQSDEVTVFLKNDPGSLNKNAAVIATDFENPTNVKTALNNYVADHTSGKIKNFFQGFETTTKAVVLKCVDNWKVLVGGSSPYSVQLTGQYNVLTDKDLGFTMIEFPKDKSVTALFIIPDVGKEEAVKAATNSANLAEWRKLLAPQSINLEVPRVTLYACASLAFEVQKYSSQIKSRSSIAANTP